MDVQNIGFNAMAENTAIKTKDLQGSDFKQIFDKVTGGETAQEIRRKYDVTLCVESAGNIGQLPDNYDFRCKNCVVISPETLYRMEENPSLKTKILSAIEEFCSPEEQAKVNALQPPVKSAGMIVYPDGNTFYWLEGYPNDFGDVKDKKVIVEHQSLCEAYRQYVSKESLTEQNLLLAMQVLISGQKP